MVKPNVPFSGTVVEFSKSSNEEDVIVVIDGTGEIDAIIVTLPEKFCRETRLQERDRIYVTPGRVEYPRCWAVYAALIKRP